QASTAAPSRGTGSPGSRPPPTPSAGRRGQGGRPPGPIGRAGGSRSSHSSACGLVGTKFGREGGAPVARYPPGPVRTGRGARGPAPGARGREGLIKLQAPPPHGPVVELAAGPGAGAGGQPLAQAGLPDEPGGGGGQGLGVVDRHGQARLLVA